MEDVVSVFAVKGKLETTPFLFYRNKDNATNPGGGVIKEVSFAEYVTGMRFIGAFVTRFE